jgi:hypothetical protein
MVFAEVKQDPARQRSFIAQVGQGADREYPAAVYLAITPSAVLQVSSVSGSVADGLKALALAGMRQRVSHEGLQLGRLVPPARVVQVETWERR